MAKRRVHTKFINGEWFAVLARTPVETIDEALSLGTKNAAIAVVTAPTEEEAIKRLKETVNYE